MLGPACQSHIASALALSVRAATAVTSLKLPPSGDDALLQATQLLPRLPWLHRRLTWLQLDSLRLLFST